MLDRERTAESKSMSQRPALSSIERKGAKRNMTSHVMVDAIQAQKLPAEGFAAGLAAYLQPYRQRVLDCPMLQECKAGTLALPQIRSWVAQQYHYVASFPTWLGLLLRRV